MNSSISSSEPVRRYRNSLIALICGFLLTATPIVVLNLAIDEYSLYSLLRDTDYPLRSRDFERLGKAYGLRRFQPQAVILGNSRALYGLPLKHPSLKPWRVYHLAMRQQSIYEARRYLEHAQQISPLEMAIVALDLTMFRTDQRYQPGFSETRLAIDADGQVQTYPYTEILGSLLELKPFWRYRLAAERERFWDVDGDTNLPLLIPELREGGWADSFQKLLYARPANFYHPENFDPERWLAADGPLADLRAVLELAARNETRLHLAISPAHAVFLERLIRNGLHGRRLRWKRLLVCEIDRARQRWPELEVSLWDFSGYHAIATEAPPTDNSRPMHWHHESVHYNHRVGSLMLEAMLNDSQAGPPGFARRLDGKNIDTALAVELAARSQWLQTLPAQAQQAGEWLEGAAPVPPASLQATTGTCPQSRVGASRPNQPGDSDAR